MYSFAQRSDTAVVDEPFYACYLSKTNVMHPGREEVLATQSSDEDNVKQNLFQKHGKPILFIKNMAHHIEVLDDAFLSRCINIFLIRNPKQIIASYAEVIDNPELRDIALDLVRVLSICIRPETLPYPLHSPSLKFVLLPTFIIKNLYFVYYFLKLIKINKRKMVLRELRSGFTGRKQ